MEYRWPWVSRLAYDREIEENHALRAQLKDATARIYVVEDQWAERYAALTDQVIGLKVRGAEKTPEPTQYVPAPPAFPPEVEDAIEERAAGDRNWRRVIERSARGLQARGLNAQEIAVWIRNDGAQLDS